MTALPSLGDRYTALRPLGAGGEGTVWLARDELAGGREVAVKRIPAHHAASAAHEFGLLHRLRHPGVAAVLGLERAPDDDLLLVCEVAEGSPLGAWAVGRPRDEVLAALAELLAILDFLHRRGVVHRDLKEENALRGPAGVKLVDFGLASEGVPEELSGTRGYLAPELLEGGPASPRSDLYAFGVLCARLLWGWPSLEDGADALVAAQLAGELRFPASAEADPLASLCRRLLARDPAQRPASASEVLETLAGIAGAAVGEVRRALAARGLPTPALAGRDPLLARGRLAFGAVRDGEGPRILGVAGRRGEGRSRICDELGATAALLGLRVRRGLAFEDPAGPSAPDPQAEAALARSGALDELRARTGSPVCLVLDDPVSPIALQAVLALASEPGLRLAAVVSVLAGSPAEHALEQQGAEILRLAPLALAEADALCASMLPESFLSPELAGVVHARSGGNPSLTCELLRGAVAGWLASGDPSPASLVERLTGEGGVAIEELVATRVRSLEASRRRIAAAVALFEAGTTESFLVELLDPRSRFPRQTDHDPHQPRSIRCELGGLLDAGILTTSAAGDLLLVASGALGEALLAGLEAEARDQLARRALALLETRGAPIRDRARVALAAALPGSGSILLAGAADARRVHDLGEAARLYRAAIPICEGSERRRARVALGETALALGRTELALRTLREAILEERDPAERRALRVALADAEIKAGRAADALRSLEQATLEDPGAGLATPTAKALLFAGEVERAAGAAEAAAGDPAATPRERSEALHLLGLARYTAGDLDGARAPLEQALALCPAAGDDPLERLAGARIANTLAMLHQRRGELEPARVRYLECLETARTIRHLPYQATLLQNLASVAEREGEHALALDRYQESLVVARGFGGLRETAQVLHNLARLRGHLGQHPDALELVRRSSELARQACWPALEAQNLLLEAELQLDGGVELERAGSLLDRARARFDSAGDAAGRAEAELGLARLALLRGDPERAVAIVSPLLESASGNHSVTLHAHLLRGRGELERGAHRAALAPLREALHLAEESGEQDPLLQIHASLARAHEGLGEAATAGVHQRLCRALHEDQLSRLPAELRGSFSAHPTRSRLFARLPPAVDAAVVPERGVRLDAGLLAALISINQALNAEPELERLLERIIDHAVELVSAERGFLLLSRGGSLRAEVARNIDQETIRRGELKISRSLAEEVLATGRSVVTIDAMDDQRFRSSLSVHDLRLRSVLCVPISVRRQVRGAIYLDDRLRREAFGRDHRGVIEALAEQAGLAVGIWELLEENRLRRAELEEKKLELERANRELLRSVAEQSEQLDELSSLARAQRGELEGRYRYQDLIGRGPAMRELFRLIDRAKDSLAPVLVQGESGTGKELVAKAIHYSGERRVGPFISVNCGALPASLLESELFGFERGAFTGAERQHRGLFERANGGTLFLDELGEMPSELQVKLLRVLQEKRFARVGGESELDSDFRLISASNRELGRMVREGSFREDLYYRVAVIELRLPPLRERREEIPLLVEHLLERHGGGRRVQVSREALRALLEHDWPGNVRELENGILRALALGGPTLRPEDFSLRAGPSASRPTVQSTTLREAQRRLERELVEQALDRVHGNVTEAARELGITRVGLHKLLRRLGIEKRKVT